MFNLIEQLEQRKEIVATNDDNKAKVAALEIELEAAKALCKNDVELAVIAEEIAQITEYCYELGLIARPVVEEVAPENVENL